MEAIVDDAGDAAKEARFLDELELEKVSAPRFRKPSTVAPTSTFVPLFLATEFQACQALIHCYRPPETSLPGVRPSNLQRRIRHARVERGRSGRAGVAQQW